MMLPSRSGGPLSLKTANMGNPGLRDTTGRGRHRQAAVHRQLQDQAHTPHDTRAPGTEVWERASGDMHIDLYCA